MQSSRLVIPDYKSKLAFLIDTGQTYSYFLSAKGNVAPSNFRIYTADRTPNPTFGETTLTGLRTATTTDICRRFLATSRSSGGSEE